MRIVSFAMPDRDPESVGWRSVLHSLRRLLHKLRCRGCGGNEAPGGMPMTCCPHGYGCHFGDWLVAAGRSGFSTPCLAQLTADGDPQVAGGKGLCPTATPGQGGFYDGNLLHFRNHDASRILQCFGQDGPRRSSHCRFAMVLCKLVTSIRSLKKGGFASMGRRFFSDVFS